MERIKFGKGPFQIYPVIKALKGKDGSYRTLCDHWEAFGYNLGLNKEEIRILRGSLYSGRTTLYNIPRHILRVWSGRAHAYGNEPNLRVLYEALMDMRLDSLADHVLNTFWEEPGKETHPWFNLKQKKSLMTRIRSVLKRFSLKKRGTSKTKNPSAEWKAQKELLQDRLDERKQSILDKLLKDCQAILDGRSNKGKGPAVLESFPVGSFEALEANDIWERILRYISTPSDISSAYFACPLFQEILEERRKLTFLPGVLNIFLGKADHVIKVKELLSLRGTCTAWKTVADREIFKTDLLDAPWLSKVGEFDSCQRYMNFPTIQSKEDLNEALEFLPNQKGVECFLIRQFSVDRGCFGEESPDAVTFLEAVLCFLDLHGGSVWHFHYGGARGDMTIDYSFLCKMLVRMPNLKSLSLKSVTKPREDCTNREIRLLKEILEHSPFPVLENLRHFRALRENGSFLKEIYTRCSNLKSVVHSPGKISGDLAIVLRSLSLERCLGIWGKRFYGRNWPLRVLEVRAQVKRSEMFSALNKFQETLESLTCECWSDYPDHDSDSTVTLKLPRLKVLNAELGASIRLDDLLHLKALERLITEYYVELAGQNSLIKFSPIKKHMRNSNIWAYLPNLKELVFGRFEDRKSFKFVRRGWTLSRYVWVSGFGDGSLGERGWVGVIGWKFDGVRDIKMQI